MAGRARPLLGMTWMGYAEDLAAVIEALDLKDATLVSYSTLFQHGILVVVLYQRLSYY
jgi:hypothetical protein